MHTDARKVRYLNQEKDVGVLACRSSTDALLNVMLGNVDTLLNMRRISRVPRPIAWGRAHHFVLEIVRAVAVVDSKERLIMNCAVTQKYVSGLSLKA